jgi:small-conductance mechanosensitive channel
MGRMSFFFVTVALALGVALVTGGSLRSIAATELRHPSILAVAVGIQLALEVLHPTSGTAGHLASALLVVSYVFLLLFCVANLRLRGLAVVAVGIALNGAIITVNRGMPIRAPEAAVEHTTKHHAERPSDRLTGFGDIILVPALRQSLSFGDLIMMVGLIDVVFHCSRKPSVRRRVASAQSASAVEVRTAA